MRQGEDKDRACHPAGEDVELTSTHQETWLEADLPSILLLPSLATQEAIENLTAAFPMLYRRDPNSVHFQVACPAPAGSEGARWSEVTEAIWDDVMVRGKPDNLRICLDLTFKEHATRKYQGTEAGTGDRNRLEL